MYLLDEGEKDGRKTQVQGSISQIVNIFAIVPKKKKIALIVSFTDFVGRSK